MGGSAVCWDPSLALGFAYTPSRFCYHDPFNGKAGELQDEVAKCARQRNG